MHARGLQVRHAFASARLRQVDRLFAEAGTVINRIGFAAQTANNMSRLPRRFVPATPSPSTQLPGPAVAVVTYNLLAQKYIDAG